MSIHVSGPTSSAPLQVPSRFNVAAEMLERNLRGSSGDRDAIWYRGQRCSYGDVARLTNRVGNGLRSLGVEREQRVMLVLGDSPEWVASYLGTMKIGAVAVPCNPWLGPTDYRYFLSQSRARVLVTSQDHLARLEPVLHQAPDLRHVVVVGGAPSEGAHRHSWESWTSMVDDALETADTSRDEPAFWLWTSGSTGEPKAAVHVHQDWVWCCELYAGRVLGFRETDRAFSVSKLFHAYGLGNGLMFPFWFGGSTVLQSERPAPEALYEAIDRAKPTIFFGVPTAFAAMLQVPDVEQRWDLSSIRCCVSAGESLPAGIYRRWRDRFGTEILDGLGSTEVLHIFVSNRAGAVVAGGSGTPVPGYDVRIVGDGGEDLPPGQIGDLLVRGPSTAVLYWNRPEQTRAKMRGEWFFSGDKYTCDSEGHYWYAGRSDDMFKVGGEWVSPAEVEAALIDHPSVLECAVVPFDSGAGLLKPKAVVVTTEGQVPGPALAEQLQLFVRGRLAAYKCPRMVEFVSDLPKTATGKIQRFKLRGAANVSESTT